MAWIARLLPYVLPLVAAVVFYRHVLFDDRYVLPWDLRGFHLANIHIYAEALRNGELPFWDPYTYCGRPFSANPQTGVFYPGTAVAAALGALLGDRFLLDLLELNVVMHVALAGVFALGLARSLGMSATAATLAGLAYSLGGFFAAHAQHMGAVSAATWLPLAWRSVIAMERAPWRGGLLLSLSLAMSILAGFTPMAAIVIASSVFLAVARCWRAPSPAGWRPALWSIATIPGAAALAMILLAPAMELYGLSVAKYRSDWLGTGGGIPVSALISLVWPNYHGVFDPWTYRQPVDPAFMYLYSGLMPLALAVAAWKARDRRPGVFLLMLIVAGMAMLGDSTPIGRGVWLLLPDSVRGALYPQYASAPFLLALSVLGAIGLDRLDVGRRWRMALVAASAVELIGVSSGRPMNAFPVSKEPGLSRTHFDGQQRTLARVRELVDRQTPPARIDTTPGASINWALGAPLTRVPSANGYDPLALERTMEARRAFTGGERWGSYYPVADLRSPALAEMSVRYVLSRERISAERLASSPFQWLEDVPGYSVYENRAARPRFWLAGQTTGSPGVVRVLRYGAREVELEVETSTEQHLASSETHYPGWRASIDGSPRPVSYTGVAFRGLSVPAGRHLVRFRFEPATWPAWVSAAAALLWLGLWIKER